MDLEAYLGELRDPGRTLVASKLTNLSALNLAEVPLFQDAWRGIDVVRRRQVVRQLVQLAEDNVGLDFDAVLMVALTDADADVRFMAVQGLWEHEGRDLILPLIEMMEKDPEAAVRAQAALALGGYVLQAEFERLNRDDGDRVERALRAVYENQREDVIVRARALESAGARNTSWVRRGIEEAYGSADRQMRVSAVHAMGRHCDPRWLPALIRELASDDPEMRFEAASACASLGGEAAVPELIGLLEDEDPEVQEAAIAALGEIGGEEAKSALGELEGHPEERIRQAAAAALEEIDFGEEPMRFPYR